MASLRFFLCVLRVLRGEEILSSVQRMFGLEAQDPVILSAFTGLQKIANIPLVSQPPLLYPFGELVSGFCNRLGWESGCKS